MLNLRLFISELVFKIRFTFASEERKSELALARIKQHADALGFGYLFEGVSPEEMARAIMHVARLSVGGSEEDEV